MMLYWNTVFYTSEFTPVHAAKKKNQKPKNSCSDDSGDGGAGGSRLRPMLRLAMKP